MASLRAGGRGRGSGSGGCPWAAQPCPQPPSSFTPCAEGLGRGRQELGRSHSPWEPRSPSARAPVRGQTGALPASRLQDAQGLRRKEQAQVAKGDSGGNQGHGSPGIHGGDTHARPEGATVAAGRPGEGHSEAGTACAKAVRRGRAGNILATGSRSVQLVPRGEEMRDRPGAGTSP